MEIEYSMTDTIESYDILFKKFHNDNDSYEKLDRSKKLIYLAAGLGLSNSIHERFVKSVIKEYMKKYSLSKVKEKDIISKYKGPTQIKEFVKILNLDLDEAFELNKIDIQGKFNIINSMDNLISTIDEQRLIRNNYLHGDFSFNEDILYENFKKSVIDFQELHSFILKIIRYSFLNNIDNLPNI